MSKPTRQQIEAAKAARFAEYLKAHPLPKIETPAVETWRNEAKRISALISAEVRRLDPTVGTVDAAGRIAGPAEGDWHRAARALGYEPAALAIALMW